MCGLHNVFTGLGGSGWKVFCLYSHLIPTRSVGLEVKRLLLCFGFSRPGRVAPEAAAAPGKLLGVKTPGACSVLLTRKRWGWAQQQSVS